MSKKPRDYIVITNADGDIMGTAEVKPTEGNIEAILSNYPEGYIAYKTDKTDCVSRKQEMVERNNTNSEGKEKRVDVEKVRLDKKVKSVIKKRSGVEILE